MKKIYEHMVYHLLQVFILILGLVAFIKLEGELRLGVLMLAIFSYIVTAVVHQSVNHNLHSKIVIEYVLMGALSASIIFFVLKGGIGL